MALAENNLKRMFPGMPVDELRNIVKKTRNEVKTLATIVAEMIERESLEKTLLAERIERDALETTFVELNAHLYSLRKKRMELESSPTVGDLMYRTPEQLKQGITDVLSKIGDEYKDKWPDESQAESQAKSQAKLPADSQAKSQAESQAKLPADSQAKLPADSQADSQAKSQADSQAKSQAKLPAKLPAKVQALTNKDSSQELTWQQVIHTLPKKKEGSKMPDYVNEGREIAIKIKDKHIDEKRAILAKYMNNFTPQDCRQFQDGYYKECNKSGMNYNPVGIKGTTRCTCSQENVKSMRSFLEEHNFKILCVGEKRRTEPPLIGETFSTHMCIIVRPEKVMDEFQDILKKINEKSYELHKNEIIAYTKLRMEHKDAPKYVAKVANYPMKFKLQFNKNQ